MRLLLDTHVLLWWLGASDKLSASAGAAIDSQQAEVTVSVATAWEISIKQAKGRLTAPDGLEEALADSGFRPLPIGLRHARLAGRLPEHHRDPFDRMLVAQAQLEGLTIVTRDPRIGRYDVHVLAA